MDKIKIHNLEVFAKHGVFPEENVLGQKFVISAVLYTSTRKAGVTDELTYSVNYGEVSHFIKDYVEGHTWKLLESVVEHLVEELLLQFPLLHQVDLAIQKPWAPIGLPLDTVSVEISRKWHTAYIALGSNIGDTKGYLDFAVKSLDERKGCQVQKVSDYLVTSVDFTDLVTELMDYDFSEDQMYTVPGETVMGDQYEEYYVDEDALLNLIMEVFYVPV